jgi:hypothetical protein
MLDTIALKFAIGHKLVAMIFAVSFEIIIQRVVSNEPCYVIKKHFTVLYNNRSREIFFLIFKNCQPDVFVLLLTIKQERK